ncbi:hypothetical protein DOE76_13910 [Leifsonia sp. ku-ls]|nr:hypothetical protein DOE76_13910 [Leifsonia sp. ku-ls]
MFYGTDPRKGVKREHALQLSSVSKVNNLLKSVIMQAPLRAFGSDGQELAEQPNWIVRTDSIETPGGRMAAVLDDGIFYGCSALRVIPDAKGGVLQLQHIPYDNWSIKDNRVLVDDKPVDQSEIILIDWPFDGLLKVASRAIRHGLNLKEARHARGVNPLPLLLFSHVNQDTKGAGLNEEERKALIDGYKRAQAEGGSAVAYMPPGIKAEAFGQGEIDFFEAATNASTVEMGQFTNVRASMLDGTLPDVSSDTYKNAAGERSAFLVFDVPFWTRPIEEALSNDRAYGGACPRGQYVRFDFSTFYNAASPTGLPAED